MNREELRIELASLPVDINGEFRNPLKLVADDDLFNECVEFWKGLEVSSKDVNATCAHLGTLESIPLKDLRSIQFGIKADKVEALLSRPEKIDGPVVAVKTKKGYVLLDGNTRTFIRSKMEENDVKAWVLRLEKKKTDGSKLFEKILEDKPGYTSTFYEIAAAELHDCSGVTVYSDEPFGSNYSCFDFDNEGDDTEEGEETETFIWKDCTLTMDDDGIYWKSKNGKTASLLIYTIVKMDVKKNRIRVWVAPHDSSDDMGVVDFYRSDTPTPEV